MKNYILDQFRYFFINPVWKTWIALAIIVISFVLNGLAWYYYLGQFHEIISPSAVGFSSGVLLLNLFLANITFPKEQMISYVLLGTSLLIQLFTLVSLKITMSLGAF